MIKFILFIMAVFYLSGCSIAPKADAVRSAVDQGEFKGLDKYSKFSISLPSSHSGPYAEIDQLNFKIDEGMYKDKNASAILGKSEGTEEWDVLMIMVDNDGKWIELPNTD